MTRPQLYATRYILSTPFKDSMNYPSFYHGRFGFTSIDLGRTQVDIISQQVKFLQQKQIMSIYYIIVRYNSYRWNILSVWKSLSSTSSASRDQADNGSNSIVVIGNPPRPLPLWWFVGECLSSTSRVSPFRSKVTTLQNGKANCQLSWLVVYPSEHMKVSLDDYSQYIEKHLSNHQPVSQIQSSRNWDVLLLSLLHQVDLGDLSRLLKLYHSNSTIRCMYIYIYSVIIFFGLLTW